MTDRRARIGVLAVSYGLFDAAMPDGFRAARAARADLVAARLAPHVDVVSTGVVDSEDGGAAAGRAFADAGVDAVVFVPTMAAPPSYTMAALEEVPDVPVLAIVVQEAPTVPDDYDTELATERSAPVGLTMTTNALVRIGRHHRVVVGADEAATWERMERWARGVRAATRLRGARLLAVGEPIPGYLDVEATPDELADLGVTVVKVDAGVIAAAVATADASKAAALANTFTTDHHVAVDAAQLDRGTRLAVALGDLVAATGVVGGAVNCHGDTLRWNPGVGTTACLAVACSTVDGFPFACTGDLPTAAALVLGREVAGHALYSELYQLDIPGDWVLVANGGEGDIGWRKAATSVRLLPEDHYAGSAGAGVAVAWEVPEGPATLIGLTPTPMGWRLLTAEGAVVGSRHPHMEGPSAMFRFANGPVTAAFARWAEAGATHHAVLVPGLHDEAWASASEVLGVTRVVV